MQVNAAWNSEKELEKRLVEVVIASMLNRVDLNKLEHVELILDEALFSKSPGFRLAG